MRLIALIPPLFAVLIAVSCSRQSEEGNTVLPSRDAQAVNPSATPAAPFAVAEIMIVPSIPDRRSTLALSGDGIDLSSARIQWYANGSPVTAENPLSLNCADLSRGTQVEARVQSGDREIRSAPVTIGNTPPELASVRLLPEVFAPGENFRIEATAGDLDGDTVILQYAWTKNGVPAGKSARIDTAVKRGDDIQVIVTPFDGLDVGAPATVQREIRNFPPSFVEHTRLTFTGNMYIYQAQAIDPDGDALTYSLGSPMEGVAVNRVSGQVVWTVPPEFTGELPVTLVADDGNGGTARYTVTFSLR